MHVSNRARDGYLHPAYGDSLREFGMPKELVRSGGWILRKQIWGTSDADATGFYPLFLCLDWSQLAEDLEELEGQIVSLVVVSDPFGDYHETLLRRSFPDLVRPFKVHYVIDLSPNRDRLGSAHHRYYARWARRRIRVERANRPTDHLDEWTSLYSEVLRRHSVRGISRFSRPSFQIQLGVPGLIMFRAFEGDQVVGAQLWMIQGEVGYSHLTAINDRGYRTRAAYALVAEALDHFSGRLCWLDLGGGAGLSETELDGLARFKRGWSTGTRTAYLCGRIFDRRRYDELAESTGTRGDSFFPAYRAREIA